MKFIIFIIISFMLFSCTAPKNTSKELPIINLPKLNSQTDKLGIDDIIEIKVYGDENLSRLFRIEVEGYISYPIVGKIKALGKSSSELAQEISKKLQEKYFKNPQVTVFVKEKNSLKVYVLGEVKKPGAYKYISGMTILKLIANSGGFTNKADKNQMKLRRKINDEVKSVSIPASYIINGKIEDVVLLPGDIIYIPESWL